MQLILHFLSGPALLISAQNVVRLFAHMHSAKSRILVLFEKHILECLLQDLPDRANGGKAECFVRIASFFLQTVLRKLSGCH